MLLQQIAILGGPGATGSRRKQGLHLLAAADRYERSGHVSSVKAVALLSQAALTILVPQKGFSRVCFKGALLNPPTQTPGWRYANDFLHYALGRQAYSLGDHRSATQHFAYLLHWGVGICGQDGILADFMLAYRVSTPRISTILFRKQKPRMLSELRFSTKG